MPTEPRAADPGALAIAEQMEWGHTDPSDYPRPEWDACYFCDQDRGTGHGVGCRMAALLQTLRAAREPLRQRVAELEAGLLSRAENHHAIFHRLSGVAFVDCQEVACRSAKRLAALAPPR